MTYLPSLQSTSVSVSWLPMSETYEEKAIRLLTLLTQSSEPVSSDETWTLDDIAVMAELNDSGYIRAGDVVRAGQGQIVAIMVMNITTRGREYLSQLKKQEEANTSVGFVKEHRFAFYKWFWGIVATVISAVVVAYLVFHYGLK